MSTLRERVIRLAHLDPTMRPHLLTILRQAGVARPGDVVKLYHLPVSKGHLHRQDVTVVEVKTGFTPYGPSPLGTFYVVRADSGEELTLPDYFFQPGKPPEKRDPLEEAFKHVQSSLKRAGLLANLKRVNSTKRNGRRLEVPFGKPAPTLQEVSDALASHPNIEMRGLKGVVQVQTAANEFARFDVELRTYGIPNMDAPFAYLEMYQGF